MHSLNFSVIHGIFQLNVEYNFYRSFLQFAFNTFLSLYRSFTVKNFLKKQISLISALGYVFFGTIIHTMMTAMIKPPDPHSDSEDSDSPQPPPSTSNTKSPPLNSKPSLHTLIIIYILILIIIFLLKYLSPFQVPPLSSPPYFHNSSLPDDTNCDSSSNDSPIHNVWQSTQLYPPTPPPIKTKDIPLTSVNIIFDQPESPAKTY